MAASDIQHFGDGDGLEIVVHWDDLAQARTSDERTAGRLRLSIWGTPIWSAGDDADEGVWSTWIDLAEHLAGKWPRIEWEQGDPLGLNCDPDRLLAEARKRWEIEERDEVTEERAVWQFLQAHDLAAVGGIQLPSVHLLRMGNLMRVFVAQNRSFPLPFAATIGVLTGFVDHVVDRVREADDRGRALAKRWSARTHLDEEVFLRLATGMDVASLRKLAGRESLGEVFELTRERSDNELLAVARMAARTVSASDIQKVLRHVRQIERPRGGHAVLDALAVEARAELASVGTAVRHVQGFEVARWLRRTLGNERGRVDPGRLLESWGISIQEINLEAGVLDAVCVWGGAHAPTILLNRNGRRAGRTKGRNATLAHEIAHLLVDRDRNVAAGRGPRR